MVSLQHKTICIENIVKNNILIILQCHEEKVWYYILTITMRKESITLLYCSGYERGTSARSKSWIPHVNSAQNKWKIAILLFIEQLASEICAPVQSKTVG